MDKIIKSAIISLFIVLFIVFGYVLRTGIEKQEQEPMMALWMGPCVDICVNSGFKLNCQYVLMSDTDGKCHCEPMYCRVDNNTRANLEELENYLSQRWNQ